MLRIVCPAFIVSNVPIWGGTGDNPRASWEVVKSLPLPRGYIPSLWTQVVKLSSWDLLWGRNTSPLPHIYFTSVET